jgi:soluble lytic murein transglycosylase-like protein
MQVSKGTAAEMGLNRDIPEQNVLAGKLYLTKLLHQFNGDIRLSLAAYNAGPGTIKDAIRHTGVTDWPVVKDYLEEHLSPKKFAEVKNYPDKVISYASQFMTKGDAADQGMAYLLENNGLIKNANQQIADEMNI